MLDNAYGSITTFIFIGQGSIEGIDHEGLPLTLPCLFNFIQQCFILLLHLVVSCACACGLANERHDQQVVTLSKSGPMTNTKGSKPQNLRALGVSHHLATRYALVCRRHNIYWPPLKCCTIDGRATSHCNYRSLTYGKDRTTLSYDSSHAHFVETPQKVHG